MNTGKKLSNAFIWFVVVLLQLIMTQVVTFVFSLLMPEMEKFQQSHSVLFAVFLGIAFSIGVFLSGWLALKRGWLKVKPKYLARLVATLIGAYIPLIVALILLRTLEPGNPFFLISILASILGFYIPGWLGRQ